MKKKEIEKIEYQLSDTEVPDSVLNIARAEMSKAQKPALRKFNLKIVLSCAASFVLCLAIILPVTLSSFDSNGDYTQPPSADSSPFLPDLPSQDASGDSSSAPPQGGASAGAMPIYTLSELDENQVYPGMSENDSPIDNDSAIKYLSHIKYSAWGMDIISQESYAYYGVECTVYTLYNLDFRINELEKFRNFESNCSVEGVNVKYKIADGNYLAEAYYNDYRYCFTGDFENNSIFEGFCRHLFQKN